MLARKSRKNIVWEEESKERICKAAGYIRLSVVKEGQTYDSFATQTAIIENHVAGSDEMVLHKLYIDENVSGATFERKAFQEMLSDIEKGTVNCVIVKDLSRLGRNFLETGYYIEEYFPVHHVRFIAIADEFGTINGMTNNVQHEPMNGIGGLHLLCKHMTITQIHRSRSCLCAGFFCLFCSKIWRFNSSTFVYRQLYCNRKGRPDMAVTKIWKSKRPCAKSRGVCLKSK